MNIASFSELRKNIKQASSDDKEIRIALLSDSASQFIVQAIKGWGVSQKINYTIYEADYNQIERQILDFESDLYRFNPSFLIIVTSTEKLIKSFYKKNTLEKNDFAQTQIEHLILLCDTVASRLTCKIILNTYIEVNDSVFGNFALKTKLSCLFQTKNLNMLLTEFVQSRTNILLLDVNSLVSRAGYNTTFDPKMYYGADMIFSIDFLPYYAKNLHDMIGASTGQFKKCLIVDLDNTMWGGIIAEDGIEGLEIGDLGDGKIFSELQLWVKQLQSRGILICVCSKNTEEIAKSAFISHPDMILRLEDIAVFVANWENKADNIRYIHQVLNIGLDSMVFIDDSPFERRIVKTEIPEISVPDLPEDPAEYLRFLQDLNLFETASFTEEDQSRTVNYQADVQRSQFQRAYTNEEDFLSSLEMTCIVKPLDKFDIPRISQLSLRSNQFNLRTIRYSEQDLFTISLNPSFITYSFSLLDKIGNNGIIAFVVIEVRDETTLFIENWAMSCRVLKRGMELFTLSCIVDDAKEKGYKSLEAEYIPSRKNQMVKDLFPDLGFKKTGENRYSLQIDAESPERKTGIKRT